MKTISISAIFVILIIFCSPLLSIKDTYKNMEYEQIGDSMLGNVYPFIDTLDSTASAAEEGLDFIKDALSVISNGIAYVGNVLKAVRDFVVGIFGKLESESPDLEGTPFDPCYVNPDLCPVGA